MNKLSTALYKSWCGEKAYSSEEEARSSIAVVSKVQMSIVVLLMSDAEW